MLYICISLITSGVKYFFILTCCPFVSSLGKSLFKWSANTFSYCVGGLLTLWILSFAVHNFSVMCSPLFNCAFVACPFGVISMKSSLNLMSWGFSLFISSESFIVSWLMFKHKLTFIHVLRWGLIFILLHVNIQFFQQYPFPTMYC